MLPPETCFEGFCLHLQPDNFFLGPLDVSGSDVQSIYSATVKQSEKETDDSSG